jgi:RNA 2',3'-cyclic 3'-phosphodiesterase
MTVRAFVAVEVPDVLKQEIAGLQKDLRHALASASSPARVVWVAPPSFHLTLKFLGQTDEEDLERLRESIADAVAALPGTRLPLARLGAFPNASRPTALWTGPFDAWRATDQADRLAHLHDAVETCCEAIGATRDRRAFHPHLTLARVKEGGAQVGRILEHDDVLSRALSLSALPVESVAMMKSETRPTGSVYTRLWTVDLG